MTGPKDRKPQRTIPLGLAGAVGFVGSVSILTGISQSGSPFVSKLPDSWYFGLASATPGTGQDSTFLGIMAVYLGVILMVGSWYEIVRTLRRNPGTPVKNVVAIIVAWAVPVMAMPPLFSRDVYSYAAQGEMVSRGINPYIHGPTSLGPSAFLGLVDPIWQNARAPYGPAWERLAGEIVRLDGHDVITTIVGFRLIALIGVSLIAWGVPVLARSVTRDPAPAIALAVLNPLVLLVLLGGAHNDALMLGLLVAGCAAARRDHVLIGLLMCALAAEVKIPALIGAVFIGWWWGEEAATWRERLSRVGAAVLMVVAWMFVIGLVSGLGWSWLGELTNSGTVVSWVDPVTAVGLALSHGSGGLGFGTHSVAYVQSARAFGLGLAAVISVGLVLRTKKMGAMQSLGWSLLVFVILGPVIWPWYETWGFVFLAVVAEGWTLRLLLALSAIACFADLPPVRYYQTTEPFLSIVCWTLLVGIIIAYGLVRLGPSINPSLSTHAEASRIHAASESVPNDTLG